MKYYKELVSARPLNYNIINKEIISYKIGENLGIIRTEMLGYNLKPKWDVGWPMKNPFIALKEIYMIGVYGALYEIFTT